jgi:hypothetical protein
VEEERTTDSLKAILKFPFQGPEWQNRLLIGAALNLANFLIPIVPSIFVNGYYVRLIRAAARGEEPGLPAWDDWGGLARDGLKSMLVGLVYMLPATIVIFGSMLLGFLLPLGMAGSGGGDSDLIGLMFPIGFLLAQGLMFVGMALGTLLYAVGIIPLPFALAHFVAEDDLGAAFRVREWWALLTADKLGYLVDWVVVAGVGAIGYTVSMVVYSSVVLCWVTPFLMVPLALYVMLVSAVLFGQRYHRNKAAAN